MQFAQTSGEGDSRGWTPPATVDNPPAPVNILGLRMRVSAAERARVQWEEILHGTCATRSESRLVYCWPDSPMVVTVDVDPSGSEGPRFIEVATARPVVLPDGPVPGLGTAFRRAPQ